MDRQDSPDRAGRITPDRRGRSPRRAARTGAAAPPHPISVATPHRRPARRALPRRYSPSLRGELRKEDGRAARGRFSASLKPRLPTAVDCLRTVPYLVASLIAGPPPGVIT